MKACCRFRVWGLRSRLAMLTLVEWVFVSTQIISVICSWLLHLILNQWQRIELSWLIYWEDLGKLISRIGNTWAFITIFVNLLVHAHWFLSGDQSCNIIWKTDVSERIDIKFILIYWYRCDIPIFDREMDICNIMECEYHCQLPFIAVGYFQSIQIFNSELKQDPLNYPTKFNSIRGT